MIVSAEPGAETHRGEPGREPAPVGEPLQRIADAGAVHGAGADAADRRGRRTASGSESATEFITQETPTSTLEITTTMRGPILVDEISFDRHEPRFRQDENA